MTVLIMERANPGLRGLLSRWFLEPRAGVFVGTLSLRVRELVWERICAQGRGSAVMIFRAANEQGFDVISYGDPTRVMLSADGLWLVMKPTRT